MQRCGPVWHTWPSERNVVCFPVIEVASLLFCQVFYLSVLLQPHLFVFVWVNIPPRLFFFCFLFGPLTSIDCVLNVSKAQCGFVWRLISKSAYLPPGNLTFVFGDCSETKQLKEKAKQ